MDEMSLIVQLLVILAAGLASGVVCKQINVSLLVGYLVVGSLIGSGGLQWVDLGSHELKLLAEAGALLLLFSVGIEFSFEELLKLSRYFLVGGSVQMLLVAIPLTITAKVAGLPWPGAVLAGFAGALSSTVLVFRALAEYGQSSSGHGRRAIGILLFQDVALVPLLLLVPLLTGEGERPTVATYLILATKSVLFVLGVWILQIGVRRGAVPLLAQLRSVELIVLGTLALLGGVCWVAVSLGLPPAVGALAAGISLSGNRLSSQVDSILLPFRETFAAVFFVTLGMLLHPVAFLSEPVLLTCGLLGMLMLKTLAATVALWCVGLPWAAAFGMGLGLSQLGEFSFLLVAEGVANNLISAEQYNRMLFIALGTLILTPPLLRFGLRLAEEIEEEQEQSPAEGVHSPYARAVIIGIGPIGKNVATRLRNQSVQIHLVDLSPINLQPFAQQGVPTLAGDARDVSVLRRAGVETANLIVVCVPVDDVAVQVVRQLQGLQPSGAIIVRCRLQAYIVELERAGATAVVSEEAEAWGPLITLCERELKVV
jgi:monovalent cation:H+ antiporter-2, CPA2 family